MEKVYIKDKQGNKVLPKTHVSAVYDDEGNDLGSHLGAFEDEVRGLVDTPHQEYVTVATYASLPASGSKDTIYRVSNYNGSTSQVDTTSYSEYAWDGSQYIFLCVKSQIDEVFDITVYNNNTKYADLTTALGTNGTNVPQSLRKGGMSVKFVQSSGNNYIQAYLIADEFTTDISAWKYTADTDGADKDTDSLSFIDENENCVLQAKEGHIQTKNFDSRFSVSNDKSTTDNLAFVDEDDNCPLEVKNGEIHTKNFDSKYALTGDNIDNDDEVLYLTDKNSNAVLQLKDGNIKTKNFDSRWQNVVKPTKLFDLTDFAGTGWTVSSDKRSASTSGNNYLMYSIDEQSWKFSMAACLHPIGSTFEVGLGKYDTGDGTLITLEKTANSSLLNVYLIGNNGNLSLKGSKVLENVSLESDKDYFVTIDKVTGEQFWYNVSIYDMLGNVDTIEEIGRNASSGFGNFVGRWGKPCFKLLSGTSLSVRDFSFGYKIDDDLKCIALGHSYIEGFSLSDMQQSFIGLSFADIGEKKTLNLGKGGETTTGILSHLDKYIEWFSNAKYAIINIGMNDFGNNPTDENITICLYNMQKISDKLNEANITPVWILEGGWLNRPDVSKMQPYWNWILAQPFYVDTREAFDRTDETQYLPDGSHPTAASNYRIYKCIKAQANYLFV